MNNKGFTLVEILAVITIITLLTIVAVPSAMTFQENMKRKMFCSKVETVERAGRMYGNDVMETIKGDKIPERMCSVITETSSSACQFITINALLSKGYLKKEVNAVRKDGDKKIYDEFYDPRNWVSMKNDYVVVYVDNERVYAKYVYKNLNDSKTCNKEDAEKKEANESKIFDYYYEEEHDVTDAHGKVMVW